MNSKHILVASALMLFLAGCGKDATEKTSSHKALENHNKVEVSANKPSKKSDKVATEKKTSTTDKATETKTTTPTSTSTETTTAKQNTATTTGTSQSKTPVTSETTKSPTSTTTSPTKTTTPSAPKPTTPTAPKPTTPTAPKPTTPTASTPSAPTPSAPTPTTPPPAPKVEKITFDTLDKFDSRSSSYQSVQEPQLSPLNLGNYSETPIMGNVLVEMATGRASLSEMRSTIVGKADGNYKVTGVYTYVVTIPYLQESYTTEEWNTNKYFYNAANKAGLFDAQFTGTRFDRMRGVLNQNNLQAGMRVTRVVVTFEKL